VTDPAAVQRTFSREELMSFHGTTVEDLLAGPHGPPTRLLFVGINPGLWTAAVGAHFARRGNRFWPAVHRAGITERLVEASNGMTDGDREMVFAAGVGITNIVARATARADEVTVSEMRAGGRRLVSTVERLQPRVVAVLGITAYRQAFERPAAVVGRQPEDLAGAELWVLGNPSGLNAHETVDSLAESFRAVARAAGC
jgi:TDG/mug DNA glycosylase family protein